MRWRAIGIALVLVSCARGPGREAPHPHAPSVAAVVANKSPWPDVLAPLPLDRRSEGDAALVVAIERYPNLPAVPGARESGASWVRFLTTLFGIPDRAARRAVEIASARGAPGMLRTLHDTLAGLGAPKVVLQRVAALAARATASLATPSAQDSDHAG